MAEKELNWSAPEFKYYEKGTGWYWLSILAAGLIILIAFWQRNFLFAAFVVIAEVVFLKLGAQVPHPVNFRLTDVGLEIGGKKMYSYQDLIGFATRRVDQHEDGLSELILKRKHRLSTYVKVLYFTKHSEELRLFINKHLPEIEYEDSLVEHLSKLLRF